MQTIEYKEGYNAYLDGEGKETNPYHSSKEQSDPDKFDDWLQGWFDAMDYDEDLW